MKIHFVGILDGDQKNYRKVTTHLSKLNHTLVTDHYLHRTIKDIKAETPRESKQFRKNRSKWLRSTHIFFFEGTKQDINLGIEIADATSLLKPVIIFYKEKISSMLERRRENQDFHSRVQR